jgi:hypothetical protein
MYVKTLTLGIGRFNGGILGILESQAAKELNIPEKNVLSIQEQKRKTEKVVFPDLWGIQIRHIIVAVVNYVR